MVDGTATQLCLLRETLATVSTEAETALALQGLGSSPIVLDGNAATKRALAARCGRRRAWWRRSR